MKNANSVRDKKWVTILCAMIARLQKHAYFTAVISQKGGTVGKFGVLLQT